MQGVILDGFRYCGGFLNNVDLAANAPVCGKCHHKSSRIGRILIEFLILFGLDCSPPFYVHVHTNGNPDDGPAAAANAIVTTQVSRGQLIKKFSATLFT